MNTKHTDSVEAIEAKLVDHLVNRFLGWHLPKDFKPDGGIMFMDVYDNGTEQGGKFEPTGTNLFTAEQAKEMFRFLLENEDGSSALQATQSQQVEEAIKTRFRALCTINDDGDCKYFRDDIHTRLLRGDKFVAEEILQALTPNHPD